MNLEKAVIPDASAYRWVVLAIGAMVQAVVAGAAWTIMPVLFYEISQPQSVGLGLSLVELGAIWGLSTGAVIICFVVPLEHPSLGPSLAGAINGILLASVFAGGFLSPVAGNLVAEKMGGATAIVCWGACFLVAALIFMLVMETHPERVAKG